MKSGDTSIIQYSVRWDSNFGHWLSVVFYDNGSSRIGVNVHKYVADLKSSSLRIL